MSEDQKQNTFLSCADLLQHYADRCKQIGAAVSYQQKNVAEPYSQELAKIAEHQQELVTLLQNYALTGPEAITSTRIQYKLDQPALPEIDSPGQAVQQTNAVNQQIVAELEDQAAKSIPEHLQEALQGIAREARQINQQISMVRVTAQDV